jgi:hypothetical protein
MDAHPMFACYDHEEKSENAIASGTQRPLTDISVQSFPGDKECAWDQCIAEAAPFMCLARRRLGCLA